MYICNRKHTNIEYYSRVKFTLSPEIQFELFSCRPKSGFPSNMIKWPMSVKLNDCRKNGVKAINKLAKILL